MPPRGTSPLAAAPSTYAAPSPLAALICTAVLSLSPPSATAPLHDDELAPTAISVAELAGQPTTTARPILAPPGL